MGTTRSTSLYLGVAHAAGRGDRHAGGSLTRGEAAFFKEGGVSLALLGESATGTPLGVILDATHLRAKPRHLPRARPLLAGYISRPETPKRGEGGAGDPLVGGGSGPRSLFHFAAPHFPRICLVRYRVLLQVNLPDTTALSLLVFSLFDRRAKCDSKMPIKQVNL